MTPKGHLVTLTSSHPKSRSLPQLRQSGPLSLPAPASCLTSPSSVRAGRCLSPLQSPVSPPPAPSERAAVSPRSSLLSHLPQLGQSGPLSLPAPASCLTSPSSVRADRCLSPLQPPVSPPPAPSERAAVSPRSSLLSHLPQLRQSGPLSLPAPVPCLTSPSSVRAGRCLSPLQPPVSSPPARSERAAVSLRSSLLSHLPQLRQSGPLSLPAPASCLTSPSSVRAGRCLSPLPCLTSPSSVRAGRCLSPLQPPVSPPSAPSERAAVSPRSSLLSHLPQLRQSGPLSLPAPLSHLPQLRQSGPLSLPAPASCLISPSSVRAGHCLPAPLSHLPQLRQSRPLSLPAPAPCLTSPSSVRAGCCLSPLQCPVSPPPALSERAAVSPPAPASCFTSPSSVRAGHCLSPLQPPVSPLPASSERAAVSPRSSLLSHLPQLRQSGPLSLPAPLSHLPQLRQSGPLSLPAPASCLTSLSSVKAGRCLSPLPCLTSPSSVRAGRCLSPLQPLTSPSSVRAGHCLSPLQPPVSPLPASSERAAVSPRSSLLSHLLQLRQSGPLSLPAPLSHLPQLRQSGPLSLPAPASCIISPSSVRADRCLSPLQPPVSPPPAPSERAAVSPRSSPLSHLPQLRQSGPLSLPRSSPLSHLPQLRQSGPLSLPAPLSHLPQLRQSGPLPLPAPASCLISPSSVRADRCLSPLQPPVSPPPAPSERAAVSPRSSPLSHLPQLRQSGPLSLPAPASCLTSPSSVRAGRCLRRCAAVLHRSPTRHLGRHLTGSADRPCSARATDRPLAESRPTAALI